MIVASEIINADMEREIESHRQEPTGSHRTPRNYRTREVVALPSKAEWKTWTPDQMNAHLDRAGL